MDATTIVFAIIAIFVIWKLYSVLGTRTGAEPPPFDPNLHRDSAGAGGPGAPRGPGQIIRLPGAAHEPQPAAPPPLADPQRWKDFLEPGAKAAAGLDAIAAADRSFDPANFLSGAKIAYETIVVAFAKGDRDTLAGLLATDVLDSFSKAINDRVARGETMETKIVAIEHAKIDDARLVGGVAQVAVRFAAKLVSFTRDQAGKVIEGSAEAIAEHLDLWTFARDVSSRNPNWRLIATDSGH